MGEALLRFDKEAGEWLSKRFKSEKADVALYQEYELRSAIKNGDVANVARELAEHRLRIGEPGSEWQNGGETRYAAGWADFEEYRTNAGHTVPNAGCSGEPTASAPR